MNKFLGLGRLTADCELRRTQNGKSVTSFTLAVNRRGKDAGADFIDCVAWEKTAEFISRYFAKGSQIAIVGRIQTRTWEDNDGKKRKATEVVVEEAHFADSKKGEQEDKLTPMDDDRLPFNDDEFPFLP